MPNHELSLVGWGVEDGIEWVAWPGLTRPGLAQPGLLAALCVMLMHAARFVKQAAMCTLHASSSPGLPA
jgi:hypothetical protein